jgi:hypothetical protein
VTGVSASLALSFTLRSLVGPLYVIVIWMTSTTLSPALRITRCVVASPGADEAGDRFFGQTRDEAD